ncbi:MAG: hypothetical protein BZ151_01710 [Desulfobacca sp. 4484_104]|nr:MAG: hypothetical protein BZ151_01710 [Desulfobacca sp. 4484_104]RLA87543.1 MAG: hypothetical protein DRG58_10510 [Deltaproteobacteria bacterium]
MLRKWWRGQFYQLQSIVQLSVFIMFICMLTSPALAHRAIIFAYAEGDTIHTESKFVPDTPVRQGEVQVLDRKTGKVLLTGQTDDQGKFSFKIPAEAVAQQMDLEIVLDAGMGHRGEWLLRADSYLKGVRTATAPASTSTPVAAKTPAGTVDRQQLEEVINKALERQLGPIKEMLTELTVHRTSLPDIIGGIGYILGIFGLWAYFQSRRKKNP